MSRSRVTGWHECRIGSVLSVRWFLADELVVVHWPMTWLWARCLLLCVSESVFLVVHEISRAITCNVSPDQRLSVTVCVCLSLIVLAGSLCVSTHRKGGLAHPTPMNPLSPPSSSVSKSLRLVSQRWWVLGVVGRGSSIDSRSPSPPLPLPPLSSIFYLTPSVPLAGQHSEEVRGTSPQPVCLPQELLHSEFAAFFW